MKITKSQLKQIIKEVIAEGGDPRDFPGGYESEPRRDIGRLVDPILTAARPAYEGLSRSPEDQEELEKALLNGLQGLVSVWQADRPGKNMKEEEPFYGPDPADIERQRQGISRVSRPQDAFPGDKRPPEKRFKDV